MKIIGKSKGNKKENYVVISNDTNSEIKTRFEKTAKELNYTVINQSEK